MKWRRSHSMLRKVAPPHKQYVGMKRFYWWLAKFNDDVVHWVGLENTRIGKLACDHYDDALLGRKRVWEFHKRLPKRRNNG
jgi:hypothetical protein